MKSSSRHSFSSTTSTTSVSPASPISHHPLGMSLEHSLAVASATALPGAAAAAEPAPAALLAAHASSCCTYCDALYRSVHGEAGSESDADSISEYEALDAVVRRRASSAARVSAGAAEPASPASAASAPKTHFDKLAHAAHALPHAIPHLRRPRSPTARKDSAASRH